MARALGIMGGTFDPVHYGHLVAAEQARARFGLERVIFVPNHAPPHKRDYQVTPAERRHEMVVLATASHPCFEVSRIEIDRPGPSYSVDTLHAFREKLGGSAELYFITGADAVLEVATWHEPEQLFQLCELVAVTRPGHHLDEATKMLTRRLLERIHVLPIPGVDISSTELRRRARSGESLRYLTPPAVVSYLQTHGLYRDGSTAPGGLSSLTPE